MANQSSAQAQYLLRANFATSLSAMSASHYLLGIGDRHDGNTLVSNRGLLVGIDFGMAFGKATWVLPVPELVPFRLTKQMRGVLMPLDPQALLKRSMTCVLSALRANKQMLIQNLSIFLDDPTMDWIADSKDRSGFMEADAEDGVALGGGRAGNTSAGDSTFLRDRMQVLKEKLNGKHPCEVMKIDIKSSRVPWVEGKRGNFNALLDRVGSFSAAASRPGPFSSPQVSLSAADQVFSLPPLPSSFLLSPPSSVSSPAFLLSSLLPFLPHFSSLLLLSSAPSVSISLLLSLLPRSLPRDSCSCAFTEQVEKLVDMATHPATLSRIWEGWAPWK